jgi:hypothetical protein
MMIIIIIIIIIKIIINQVFSKPKYMKDENKVFGNK